MNGARALRGRRRRRAAAKAKDERGESARKVAAKAAKPAKTRQRQAVKPIELYYWPTPNGFKISIMLEECGLPYTLDPGEHLQGRAVQAGFPEDLAEQPHAGDRRSGRPGRQGRSRSSSPARSCNISAARPASSIRATSAGASRSTSGCSGRWAASARWPGRCTTSAITRVETLTYAINRYVNEVNRLYGVMNMRLRTAISSPANIRSPTWRCVGWVNGWERQGQDINEFPTSQALARDGEGAPGGPARHGARPRAAPGHRHEGSESAGGAVRPAREGGLTK